MPNNDRKGSRASSARAADFLQQRAGNGHRPGGFARYANQTIWSIIWLTMWPFDGGRKVDGRRDYFNMHANLDSLAWPWWRKYLCQDFYTTIPMTLSIVFKLKIFSDPITYRNLLKLLAGSVTTNINPHVLQGTW